MPSGLLLIDKPEGLTSRDVDNRIQRLFHTRKVGHLGTLDPFATGVLVVAVESATKYLPFLPDEEKTYLAYLQLGTATSTGDKTGEVIETREVPTLNKENIKDVLSKFLGESTQIPPMTSAIKKDGIALYKLAHQGKSIEREARQIYVHSIELVSLDSDGLAFKASVSKGTYIRTLGEDIAKALGTVGHLTSLCRLAVGPISLSECVKLDEVSEAKLKAPSDYVFYPRITLEGKEEFQAQNGVPMYLKSSEKRVLVQGKNGPIAIYEKADDGRYICLRGL